MRLAEDDTERHLSLYAAPGLIRKQRGIADDTSLLLQTVRTILDKDVLLDRGSRKILERIAADHLREKLHRAEQAGRKALPKRIDAWLKQRVELSQEARGVRWRRRRLLSCGKWHMITTETNPAIESPRANKQQTNKPAKVENSRALGI